jgi:hydroxymethylpyrimidine/phosphomethylpyrimidine kinase
VVDPVMTAKGGQRLLDGSAEAAVRDLLVPRAALLTPNAPEAEALTGLPVRDEAELRRAGEALLELGAGAVLMKGGHLPGDMVVDLLLSAGGLPPVREQAGEDTAHPRHRLHPGFGLRRRIGARD